MTETQRVPQDRPEVPKQTLKQHGCKYLTTGTQSPVLGKKQVGKLSYCHLPNRTDEKCLNKL